MSVGCERCLLKIGGVLFLCGPSRDLPCRCRVIPFVCGTVWPFAWSAPSTADSPAQESGDGPQSERDQIESHARSRQTKSVSGCNCCYLTLPSCYPRSPLLRISCRFFPLLAKSFFL